MRVRSAAPGEVRRVDTGSVVDRVADELRQALITAEDGAYMGSEESLSQELGVSAPTFRQAARLLEYEQLLRIKRGVSGGYYVRRPEMDAVTHVAAIYLRTHDATLEDHRAIAAALSPLMVRRAIGCPEPRHWENLKAMNRGLTQTAIDEIVADERAFNAVFLEMVHSPAARLIIAIFSTYGMLLPRPRDSNDRQLAERLIVSRTALIEALFAKDEARALDLVYQRQAMLLELIAGEPASEPASAPAGDQRQAAQ